jgi:hypothetical protein
MTIHYLFRCGNPDYRRAAEDLQKQLVFQRQVFAHNLKCLEKVEKEHFASRIQSQL